MISQSILVGKAGAIGLLLFYFSITGAVSGFTFAWAQFLDLWYWIISLAIGFGIQAGLYTFLRLRSAHISSGALAGSGGASGLAMIICCAHRLVDIAPLVGFAFIATALIQYQTYFFVFGLISNIVGIIYLVRELFARKVGL